MKKVIEQHDDQNFVKGAARYMNLDRVIDSRSWQEFFNWMERFEDKDYIQISFNEYKLTALVLHIEQLIIAILDKFYQDNNLKIECIKSEVLNSIISYRRLSEPEALLVIREQTDGKESRLINSNIFIYIAGMGLGNIIHLLSVATKKFEGKTELIKDLQKFNKNRNDAIHNSLSSRLNFPLLLSDSLSLGLSIYERLDAFLGQQLEKEQRITPSSRLKVD